MSASAALAGRSSSHLGRWLVLPLVVRRGDFVALTERFSVLLRSPPASLVAVRGARLARKACGRGGQRIDKSWTAASALGAEPAFPVKDGSLSACVARRRILGAAGRARGWLRDSRASRRNRSGAPLPAAHERAGRR